MLRLERASKSGEVHVHLRTRERFFNPVFCTALGIAVILHLVGILFFHVKPFKIESQWVIPAVKVNSEIGVKVDEGDAYVLAQIEEGKLLTPNSKAPPRSHSALPDLSEVYVILPRTLPEEAKEVAPSPPKTLQLKSIPLDFSFTYDSFEMAISGRLGERELLKQMGPDEKMSSVASLHRIRSRYLVRIDERTGTIFWSKRIESTKQFDLDQKAERILASLQFRRDPTAFDTEGEIEITFAMP